MKQDASKNSRNEKRSASKKKLYRMLMTIFMGFCLFVLAKQKRVHSSLCCFIFQVPATGRRRRRQSHDLGMECHPGVSREWQTLKSCCISSCFVGCSNRQLRHTQAMHFLRLHAVSEDCAELRVAVLSQNTCSLLKY